MTTVYATTVLTAVAHVVMTKDMDDPNWNDLIRTACCTMDRTELIQGAENLLEVFVDRLTEISPLVGKPTNRDIASFILNGR